MNRINESVGGALGTVLCNAFVVMLFSAASVSAAGTEDSSTGEQSDPQRGKKVFEMCAACHSVSQDGAHAMGPNLRGILGQKAGSRPGFKYSKAMSNSGIVWTEEELAAFLASPMTKIPNNAMPYFGLKDPTDRRAVVEYLSTLE